jgi:hypothetical protein
MMNLPWQHGVWLLLLLYLVGSARAGGTSTTLCGCWATRSVVSLLFLMLPFVATAALVAAVLPLTAGLNNGVGRTPAMGYNTWNDFRCSGISAENVMKVADKMVELKLASFGYEYVNIGERAGRSP